MYVRGSRQLRRREKSEDVSDLYIELRREGPLGGWMQRVQGPWVHRRHAAEGRGDVYMKSRWWIREWGEYMETLRC